MQQRILCRGKQKETDTDTNVCSAQDSTLAFSRLQYSAILLLKRRSIVCVIYWMCRYALRRSQSPTDTWGLLITAAFTFASCHNRHICLRYYDIICKMIFSKCDIVFEHSFPALIVRLAHVGPVLLLKGRKSDLLPSIAQKVFISRKYIC